MERLPEPRCERALPGLWRFEYTQTGTRSAAVLREQHSDGGLQGDVRAVSACWAGTVVQMQQVRPLSRQADHRTRRWK